MIQFWDKEDPGDPLKATHAESFSFFDFDTNLWKEESASLASVLLEQYCIRSMQHDERLVLHCGL